MQTFIIAYDLGTGGNKASLYDPEGNCVAECFESYTTHYPQNGWHEQCPEDWWKAVVISTRRLLQSSGIDGKTVTCCGISGHSLGVVPIDREGKLLREMTPIWSDSRAVDEAAEFFQRFPENEWYRITGNGFPAHLYSVFKIMWYRNHEPDMFRQIYKVIGTKDYINFKLTGYIGTDYSYASGSGVYDLPGWQYQSDLLAASGLPVDIFPEIVPSTQVIGKLTKNAAEELGLSDQIQVVCGGVDNSCMALGARNTREGRIYISLGSSAWIAISSRKPLIDVKIRPYVFTHVIPGLFTSAVSTFAAGSSFRWVRDNLCRDLKARAAAENVDEYDLMTAEAAISPVGANYLFFNPNLAGGTSLSTSPQIRGAFLGLDLRHTRADMIRAAMEGISLELRIALDALRTMGSFESEMLVVGGGSNSRLWRQILADAFEMDIVKTSIDQQAAALGAAACAAVGTGLWKDFDIIDGLHHIQDVSHPKRENSKKYQSLLPIFRSAGNDLAKLGDQVSRLKEQNIH
ncbi:MAG: pentose kinase [Leptolinea sp.]|nr:pentose kinase [Leptolinea sp.]